MGEIVLHADLSKLLWVPVGKVFNYLLDRFCVPVAGGGDLGQDLVSSWFEIDLAADRSVFAIVCWPYTTQVVVKRAAFLLQQEVQIEFVLPLEARKVTVVQLHRMCQWGTTALARNLSS